MSLVLVPLIGFRRGVEFQENMQKACTFVHLPKSFWLNAPVPVALGTIATAERKAEYQRTISASEANL